jgi:hypothetical protein
MEDIMAAKTMNVTTSTKDLSPKGQIKGGGITVDQRK